MSIKRRTIAINFGLIALFTSMVTAPGPSAIASAAAQTISCPSVADKLTAVPAAAQGEVNRNLTLLDTQISEANQRLASSTGQGGANFVQNAILGPLKDKRTSTLDRISLAIGRAGGAKPQGLAALATCTVAGAAGAGQAPAGNGNAANGNAGNAANGNAGNAANGNANAGAGAAGQTISCPTVADKLTAVPAAAQGEVNRNLTLLDTQISEANQRLASSTGQGGANFVQNAILGPLKDKRTSTLDRISLAIGRAGGAKPQGLAALATCTVAGAAGAGGAGGGATAPAATATATAPAPAATGPVASDFVDIRQVQPKNNNVRAGAGGSTGTFTPQCGNDENKHQNPDNVIVAPGVSNGAHHTHDYVGNLTTTGFSTNDSLAAGGTTCKGAAAADKSAYYWPVLRDTAGKPDGNGADGNAGQILQPQVTLTFSGNPKSKVKAIPEFLRAVTGDAKAATNGPANAHAQWTCSGFTNRVTDKYPICPGNSKVIRIATFPSCLAAGDNIDSANHRDHIVFPDQNGACPANTAAVPALTMMMAYSVPNEKTMALDTFPEQLHSPVTDHGDFINVMSPQLMNQVVNCINTGKRC